MFLSSNLFLVRQLLNFSNLKGESRLFGTALAPGKLELGAEAVPNGAVVYRLMDAIGFFSTMV